MCVSSTMHGQVQEFIYAYVCGGWVMGIGGFLCVRVHVRTNMFQRTHYKADSYNDGDDININKSVTKYLGLATWINIIFHLDQLLGASPLLTTFKFIAIPSTAILSILLTERFVAPCCDFNYSQK